MAAFTTVVEAMQQKAELLGHKPAFIFRDKYGGRRVLSFQQLYDLGGRWAAVLRSRPLGQGDLVVNTLANSPERVITELGIVLSGAASVNGQCQLADGSDLLHVLSKSRAQAIVLDPDVTNSPWNVLKCHVTLCENGDVTSDELPSLRHVYMVRRTDECGDGDFMSYLETLTDRYQANVKPDDAITVYTTSGSTGFSKLVVITHAHLISVLHDVSQDHKQHVVFNIAPLGWVGGYACYYFLKGFTRVLCDARSGSPDDMVEFTRMCIQEEKCTRASLNPAVVLQLAERVQRQRKEDGVDTEACLQRESEEREVAPDTQRKKERADTVVCLQREDDGVDKDASRLYQPRPPLSDTLSSWHWVPNSILYAGLPISRAMVKAARSLARQVIIIYAATDFNLVSTHIVVDADSYVDHDCGPPLHVVKVKVVDPEEEDKVLTVGEVGHLLVRGPGMMEYLNDHEATAAALTPDGYFRTGDIGCVDDRGHLIVQGRGGEAIMRGPYIFYPVWLEARIRPCPGVSDVMVVGVPDPLVNEELCACLVMTSDDVTVEQVRQFVEKDILASEDDPLSPRPRHYLKFESFPLTSTGKPLRRVIKEWAATCLA